MKLKLPVIILLLALTTQLVSAQVTDLKLSYTKKAELLLNDIKLSGMKAEQLIKTIGEPTKKVDYKGETSYFYDDKGIVISVTDGEVKGAGVNYNWDGDDKFPETTFTGTLTLGELAVNKDTKSEAIKGIKDIEFDCPFPLMCVSKNTSGIKCMAAFKEGKITQVVFIIE